MGLRLTSVFDVVRPAAVIYPSDVISALRDIRPAAVIKPAAVIYASRVIRPATVIYCC